MQKLDIVHYNIPKYSGVYWCDICREKNGHSGRSGAIHCDDCNMDVCLKCIQMPDSYDENGPSTQVEETRDPTQKNSDDEY